MRVSNIKRGLYATIEKLAAPFCNKIICISDAKKQSALNRKICSEEKLQIIYNGVDIESYIKQKPKRLTRENLNIPKNAFIIGMVGRVSQQKALDIFIQTAKIIKENIKDAFFIIVGNGDMENEVFNYAKDNNFSYSLLITGWQEEPLSYMELFDVAVLLSRWEGFGLVLAEYMMVGKPIVATNVGAIPNIIQNNKNGILVEMDDIKGVSKAIINLYDNKALRENLIIVGKQIVKDRFDAKRVSQEHEKLFIRLYNHR